MPENPMKLRPMGDYERPLFYAMEPEKDLEMGCIGHMRIDFGSNGKEFWHTWWPRACEHLNTEGFKAELSSVVDELKTNVLSDLAGMRRFCRDNGGYMDGGWAPNYGYVIEAKDYRFFLRCNPMPGDYNAYLTCYDRHTQEMNQTSCLTVDDTQETTTDIQMGGMV